MRPRFHFASASGWINDPHGIAVHDGEYHAFYQYVPGAVEWSAACSWGHAVGPDLLSLHEVTPALNPGDGDDGVWTGSLVASDPARIFYTAADASTLDVSRLRVAVADDDGWLGWTKGPVVVAAPQDAGVTAFRDPSVTRDGDGWLMIVGSGLYHGGGAVLAYRSDDLERWRYDGVLLSGGGDGYGTAWECPQLIELGGRHVLVFSIWRDRVGYDVRYAVGSLVGGSFAVSSWGVLTYGPAPYAPTAFRDSADRPCLTFWLRDVGGEGWAGAHSIPYRVELQDDVLVVVAHPDVSRYAVPAQDGTVPGAGIVSWSARDGQTLRLGSDIELRSGDELVIRVADDEWPMPRGDDVRVIIDGPVLEVSSTAGLFAAAVPAHDRLDITGTGIFAACSLER